MTELTDADKERSQALLKEYSEVCNNFRTLTDIRFKLLAFLPIASAAAVAVLKLVAQNEASTGGSTGGIQGLGLAWGLFGLIVTIGLVTYNARNDQLYDALVARAADIERSLNIPEGAFANRLGSWLRIPWFQDSRLRKLSWKIDHRTAVSTIYAASIALWLFVVVAFVLYEYPTRIILVAMVTIAAVTILGSILIKRQKNTRSKAIECLAREAMYKAVGPPKSRAVDGFFIAFIAVCAGKDNEDDDDLIAEYARRLCESDEQVKTRVNEFIEKCGRLSGETEKKVRKRAEFYSRLAKYDLVRLRYYLPKGPSDLEASHLVGLLTDLPPHWIYDSYHNRKGEM